jgi:hypothetical protein
VGAGNYCRFVRCIFLCFLLSAYAAAELQLTDFPSINLVIWRWILVLVAVGSGVLAGFHCWLWWRGGLRTWQLFSIHKSSR